ncbi:MAG: DUF2490 domain-containing protein [Bacteroidaceae bacterium]
MKASRFLAFSAAICLFVPTTLRAQRDDWGASYSLQLDKEITKKLDLSFEEEWRTRNDFQSTNRWMTTVGADYKVNDMLKVGADYSLINYNSPNAKFAQWEIRHRWSAFLTVGAELGRLKVSIREKYQQTIRMGVPSLSNDSIYNTETCKWDSNPQERSNPKKVLRSRVELSYNIRKCKFEPFASVEFTSTLNNPEENGISRIRYTFGTEYKLNKQNTINVFYRFNDERELGDTSERETDSHYLSIGFSHKF